MFETSQEEPSTGTTKIIGGVIAVVVVLLVVVYFAFLRNLSGPAAPSAAASGTQGAVTAGSADPMKDLTITRFNLHRDQTQTMAMWDIQVANRSKAHAYKNIHYSTNYYNAQDQVIYHNEGTLSDPVDPSDERTFSQINDGLYPVGTTRYTIELKGADPVQ